MKKVLGLQLTVKVYNSAHVSRGDLMEAEDRAAIIFHQVKIKIIWDHAPMPNDVHDEFKGEAWNPADLHLRLWTRAVVGSNSQGKDTLGFRVSTESSTAVIIADEISKRAETARTTPGDLLGLVMAHEMGHLLLRTEAHAELGIMKAQLETDLRDRTRILLGFTREQAKAVQDDVRRRMACKVLGNTGTISAASRQTHAQGDVSEAVPTSRLCIRLYNRTGVAPQTLDRAAQEATRILATAAVDIVWQHGPADSPEARAFDQTGRGKGQQLKPDTRNYLVVSIRRGDPASAFPGSLGFALPDAQLGVHPTIFYDRIEQLTHLVIITVPKMLGHVMAHEIGHVLLGSTEHSSAGIMKATWDRTDFQYDPAARMAFSPEQRRAIRQRASLRVAGIATTGVERNASYSALAVDNSPTIHLN